MENSGRQMISDHNKNTDHFQVIRGVACLMVVFNHLGGAIVPAIDEHSPWYAPLLVPLGFPWVWLFLAISGFLLAKAFTSGRFALNKTGIRDFYFRRFWRLLPLLWFSGILWAIMFYILNPFGYWPKGLNWNWLIEIYVALALPWGLYSEKLAPVMSVNSPTWSVVVEIHFCVLMPFIMLYLKSAKQKIYLFYLWLLFIGLLLARVLWKGGPTIFPYIYTGHLYNFGFFYTGMLLATYRTDQSLFDKISLGQAIFFGIFTIVFVQYLASWDLNIALAIAPLVILPAICLLIAKSNASYQAMPPRSLSEALPFRPHLLSVLEKIGIMSYSVYLLHKPIGYIYFQFISPIPSYDNVGQYFLKIISFVIPFLFISTLTFYFIENKYRYRRHQ